MENRSMFVGLDVHKETIDVSIAEGDRHGEGRHYGVIASDLEPLDKVVRALRAPNRHLHFVYEAGPCGFGIYRHLTAHGEDCVVVSPSMIPKRSGDRVKTDRRDSLALAPPSPRKSMPIQRTARLRYTRHPTGTGWEWPVRSRYALDGDSRSVRSTTRSVTCGRARSEERRVGKECRL